MCDCEELDYEEMELMLAAISKLPRAPTEEKAQVPQLVVSKKR